MTIGERHPPLRPGDQPPVPHHVRRLLGPAERQALTDHFPDYFTARETARARLGRDDAGGDEDDTAGRHLLSGPRRCAEADDEILIERVFDLETDSYLEHHVVNGYPTLPGTFVPEIAAEAALAPRARPEGDRLRGRGVPPLPPRLRPGAAGAKKIHATVLARVDDPRSCRSASSPTSSDPTGEAAGEGQAALRDQGRARAAVPAGAALGAVGVRRARSSSPIRTTCRPRPVLLTGPFVSTRQTRTHPLGKTADLRPQAGAGTTRCSARS